MTKVKYFYNPSYRAADWTAQNPFLQAGQIGFELDDLTGLVQRMKVGPGFWNDLTYQNTETYPYTDPVTNQIGDVKIGDTLDGELIIDIIRKMVSPFLDAFLSSPTNNADGSLKATAVLEIGQSVDTSVDVAYNVSNPSSLQATNNIFIASSPTIFTNEGFKTDNGAPLNMLLANSLSPTSPLTYNISLYAKSSNGNISPTVTTRISFYSTVIWGYDADPNKFPAGGTYNNPFPVENRKAAASYDSTYSFIGLGYAYMLIPVAMNPTNVQFLEVTNPSQPSNYSMQDAGVITLNNGTASYDYQVYRSEFSILFNTKMQVI